MKHPKSSKNRKNRALIIAAVCLLIAAVCFLVAAWGHTRREAAREKAEQKTEAPATANEQNQAQDKETEPDVDPDEARAEEILSGMSIQEKVDQLFLIAPEKLTGVSVVVQAGESTKAALQEHPVGGLVYFSQNLESAEQTRQMISNVQDYSRLGLLIAVDEEGGLVARVADSLGTTRFQPMYEYRDQGEDIAQHNAQVIGSEINSFGFNTDLAPVADVWSNKSNTVIGKRAYSDDFAQAAQLIPAAVRGFHDAGVICCLKHFPGHGDTSEDSHTSAAFNDKSYDELAAQEWSVFKAGIDAGADMVMIGHVTATQLDSVPATVSPHIVSDLLRGQLGFEGVVITDSLQMGAVTEQYGAGELAVLAVQAGADILLEPADFGQAETALLNAVEQGTISEERINASVRRILMLKIRYGIIQ